MSIIDPIYLDHQATCPVDSRVREAVMREFSESGANPHSSEHSLGWRAARKLEEAKEKVASLIGADQDELVITSGATEANNLALLGRDYSLRKKLIISSIEHKCVLECARYLARHRGVEIAEVSVNSEGVIDLDHLAELIDENTALIALIGVHNEIGAIQPIEQISALARNCRAPLHLDLAQAPMAIELQAIASLADTASFSGHKMYGPGGIGCLYVNRANKQSLAPIIHGGGQQDGLRSGTVPVALAVGLGVAAEILQDAHQEREDLRSLNQLLWTNLKQLPFEVRLNGPPIEHRHPGNLNVSFDGYDSRGLIAVLQPKLAISSGSACTSGIEEPSYVIRALGYSWERAQSALRISVGRSTTREDVVSATSLIRQALETTPRT